MAVNTTHAAADNHTAILCHIWYSNLTKSNVNHYNGNVITNIMYWHNRSTRVTSTVTAPKEHYCKFKNDHNNRHKKQRVISSNVHGLVTAQFNKSCAKCSTKNSQLRTNVIMWVTNTTYQFTSGSLSALCVLFLHLKFWCLFG